ASQRQSAFIEGFSLHAGTHVAADDRLGLERLARYADRPPLALSRLTLTPAGRIAYRLKRPPRHGAPELVLAPPESLGRRPTRLPPPRRHLPRYHGVFAPNAAARGEVVPPAPQRTDDESSTSLPPPARVPATLLARRLDWAALLARVFAIDVLRCSECRGGRALDPWSRGHEGLLRHAGGDRRGPRPRRLAADRRPGARPPGRRPRARRPSARDGHRAPGRRLPGRDRARAPRAGRGRRGLRGRHPRRDLG